MTKEKFTKGEWRISFGSQGCYFNQENEKQFYSTNYSMLTNEKTSIEEIEKNIKLIATAPEMYEMLKAMSSELKLCIDECNEHRKNTVNCTTITPPDLIDYQTVCEAELLLAKARGEHE